MQADDLCERWEALAAAPDRSSAEEALAALYRHRGWDPPRAVIWLDSPLAGAIAARTLIHGHHHLDEGTGAHRIWTAAAAPRLDAAPTGDDRPRLDRTKGVHDLDHECSFDDLLHVLGRVTPPAWALHAPTADLFKADLEAHPERFPQLNAEAHERLLQLLEPLFPLGDRDAARAALLACAETPLPTGWKAWREVWAPARAPFNPAQVIMTALGPGDEPSDERLRLAASVGWWWTFQDVALLVPPPESATDERGTLHHPEGPAVRYPDGYATYCWHGHSVPRALIDPGWTAADIVHASDDELKGRAAAEFGPESFSARLPAKYVVPDLRRCAAERLGWARLATDAPLNLIAGPVTDLNSTLRLYDVPSVVLGHPARVVVRDDGTGQVVPADSTDPVAAAGWLGDPSAPSPEPDLLGRIRDNDDLAELDFEVDRDDHVEDVHLACGARLEPIGGHGAGGTYFLCGDGPRRPVLYADSEGGFQILGRDLTEALQYMISVAPGSDLDIATDVAEEYDLRPLSPSEYRRHERDCESMAAALQLIMTREGNGYDYTDAWFRC